MNFNVLLKNLINEKKMTFTAIFLYSIIHNENFLLKGLQRPKENQP